jgi:hypothetical protein
MSSGPKLRVTLEHYAAARDLLDERERLCFDLVMFAGMRESEAFALWCGDVSGGGIPVERSQYKGSYEPQERTQGRRAG